MLRRLIVFIFWRHTPRAPLVKQKQQQVWRDYMTRKIGCEAYRTEIVWLNFVYEKFLILDCHRGCTKR